MNCTPDRSSEPLVSVEPPPNNSGLLPVSYTHLDVYKRQVQRFQYLGNLSGGFLLFKGCNHTLPLAVCIAAQTQHKVNIILGKRKSRGCMRYILCFIYGLDLFRFGEEQV